MVEGKPYVHWKIKNAVDLTEIDPVYLWGTVIETDKGPIDEPVFITNVKQGKKIFNYDFSPFFANGGRYLVVVRAYSGTPKYAKFDITLDADFKYGYVDYDSYSATNKTKAIVRLDTSAFNVTGEGDNATYTLKIDELRPKVNKNVDNDGNPVGISQYVTFYGGRWCLCDDDGKVQFFYDASSTATPDIKKAYAAYNSATDSYNIYEEGGNATNTAPGYNESDKKKLLSDIKPNPPVPFTKGFNESDITRLTKVQIETINAGSPVITVQALYPGDFLVPITVSKDIREGYRVSVTESDDYTIMLSGATTLNYIVKRINERAENVEAFLTEAGEKVQKAFSSKIVPAPWNSAKTQKLLLNDNTKSQYTQDAIDKKYPVGTVYEKVETADPTDNEDYAFTLAETVAYLSNGDNGDWNSHLKRIADPHLKVDPTGLSKILTGHRNALEHLANIKLAGIFCMYGEDQLQKVYADHVSTTEPQGMNSTEVCKWRSLIVGANALDRTNDPGEEAGFKLGDKAVAFDNENIIFLGQGLIDDGYIPEANMQSLVNQKTGEAVLDADNNVQYIPLLGDVDADKDPNKYGAYDVGASQYQLLPFQCTQYIAGLRSKLFYGDAIFGGEAKKEINGVGNMTIAPLFNGENKLLWQPDAYTYLNEHGVLTFTEDYNILSLTDGVTTRQSPLEEDEEGVQSIIKYAKHAVHEVLQTYIGRNITSDLQTAMESSVRTVLTAMQTQDQTLLALPGEGYDAFDIDIVLVPKSNAKQILAKAYVYLKLTPVHALRQIEVELTVQ